MSPGEISGGMDAVSGGSSDVGGGGYTSPGEADQAAADFNASLAGYGFNESIPGLGVSETGPMHSPGLSYATLNVLNDIGLGKMDIPGFSQNVEQALAAQNIHGILNQVVPALTSLAPNYGKAMAIGRGIATLHGLIKGEIQPEKALPGLVGSVIGATTNIPSGIVTGLLEGNLGKAAGAGASAGLAALANNINPLAGLAYNLSGMNRAVDQGVSNAVSNAIGGGRSGGLGSFSGSGGASAPSTSTTSTGNTYGDAYGGINPETYAVTAAIEQAAQEATQPSWKRETVAGRYGPTVQYEYGV